MTVLDLRPFDVVECVGFNELFILIKESCPEFQLFRKSRFFRESRNFRIPASIPKKFRVPEPTRYFGFSHTSRIKLTILNLKEKCLQTIIIPTIMQNHSDCRIYC